MNQATQGCVDFVEGAPSLMCLDPTHVDVKTEIPERRITDIIDWDFIDELSKEFQVRATIQQIPQYALREAPTPIRAFKIKAIEYLSQPNENVPINKPHAKLTPEDSTLCEIYVSETWCNRYDPHAGDYYILTSARVEECMHAKAFEKKYVLI